VDTVRDKIVTSASMQPSASQSEAVEALPEARTADAQLRQAEVEQISLRLQEATDAVGEDVLVTVQDRDVSLAQSWIAENSGSTRELESGAQEVQFGTGLSGGDVLRWVWSVTDWVSRRKAHPIKRPDTATAEPLTGDIRMAIAADWGTGLYGAPQIAAAIRGMARERRFDLQMHLGDVYYSGTEREIQERFLDVWPTDAGAVNRALNGNHEMYSGGFGYFGLALPAFDQQSSYFAMQNDDWVLIGLDTAYVNHTVDTKQVGWLNLVLRQADLPRRKVVLFSHHQPFSRLEHGGKGSDLRNALRHLLDDELITAWYWGHEHQCVIYDRHPEWGFHGRCLGNGGVPEARKAEVREAPEADGRPGGAGCVWRTLEPNDNAPGGIALDGPNMSMLSRADQEKFVPHGFMTLDFTGPELVERVFHANGTELFSNVIS
jgi:Calcineurin-like phosphoesterase